MRSALSVKVVMILSILFISHNGFAQEEDYVVTVKGDTIRGKLTINVRWNMPQSATIKVGKKKQYFEVYQLKAAGKKDGTIYHTIKILGKYRFAELVKGGYLSYYLYSSDEPNSVPFGYQVLVKRDGTQKSFSTLAFKKSVRTFLEDCPTVKSNFNNDLYARKDLDKIIDDYNSCIVNNTLELAPKADADKIALLKKLMKQVNRETSITDKSEIQEMLKDIEERLSKNQAIPGYLSDALKKKLEGYPDLLTTADELL